MTWTHRIMRVNELTKTGDCLKCGNDVPMYFRPSKQLWICKAAKYGYDKKNVSRTTIRNELMEKQNGKCAICSIELDKPVLDHDHTTGYVRAVLCEHCNKGLGHMRDNPELLRLAAAYLETQASRTDERVLYQW